MKRFWIAILILGFISASNSSFAQDYKKEEKAELSKPTEPVSFDKTKHDFGVLERGAPATATFKITNNKEEPLVIVHVGTSCGCTAPKYPKEPIKPGESGEIKLTYDSKRLGAFKKSAQVKTADSKFFTLYIQGDVKESQEGSKAENQEGSKK